MSFTDGKTFQVSEEDMGRNWSGRGTELFRCYFCGVRFKAGMFVRWIFTNDNLKLPPGNPFVCADCDGEDVLARMIERHTFATSGTFWYYNREELSG